MRVKVTTQKRYPAAWVFRYPPIEPGTIVPAIPATNIPDKDCLWIDTDDLKDDPYGILLYPGEYEILPD